MRQALVWILKHHRTESKKKSAMISQQIIVTPEGVRTPQWLVFLLTSSLEDSHYNQSCRLLIGYAQLGWLQKFRIYGVHPSRRSKRVRKNSTNLKDTVQERGMSPFKLPSKVVGVVVKITTGEPVAVENSSYAREEQFMCALAKQRLIKDVFHITFASSIALFQFFPYLRPPPSNSPSPDSQSVCKPYQLSHGLILQVGRHWITHVIVR